MSEEEEEEFQSSNACWICEKLIDDEAEKTRDHCHVSSKFRDAGQCSCSLEKPAKNLPNDDFKYWTEEFGSKNLELLKQEDAYPYEYMDSFKRFGEEKLPDRK